MRRLVPSCTYNVQSQDVTWIEFLFHIVIVGAATGLTTEDVAPKLLQMQHNNGNNKQKANKLVHN